jgi:biopolymer transport protein ExbB/TolQ
MEQLFSQLLNKIADPILALLILCLFGVIYMVYKSNMRKQDKLDKLQASKEAEIKELNKILLEVRESDKEMILELKNSFIRYIEAEKEHAENSKLCHEALKRNNELIMQTMVKVEYCTKR